MKNIIIFGTGGQSIDILDALYEINLIAKTYNCLGFLDDDRSKLGKLICGKRVLGAISEAQKFEDVVFVNGIGNSENFLSKRNIIQRSLVADSRFETIIHPTASVSAQSKIKQGAVIFQNVTICSNATVGKHVAILPNSVISHDVKIENYATIAGGVCISGHSVVGDSTYIGTNSSVRERITIGRECLIGMGSNVLANIEDGATYFGNPAKQRNAE